ncbi:hypothetical protein A6A08_06290 [Nocardiopsis sp. TSRI0078]|uniref:hypothetical protein n=1 Tax=unclassified Nocardiopsis TaxID=2649073 RepID=UPI00093BBCF3|nr:hypothetical protein [Nocardiopsis sp. TSRI0078]OKI16884.1 hypothetical protein A6A08_06290 [Nocardiopsis sp. TSRI0078]
MGLEPIGDVAQGPQRSACPDRYQYQADDAEIIVDHLWWRTVPGRAVERANPALPHSKDKPNALAVPGTAP